jgi:pilus assembly protein CpaF
MGFAILISEKGGAERREVFETNDVSVGRVQGNELMLPKGNVSKQHARLSFRDGRFLVTDNKSTNGTYVNGRKIAQALVVREGDKIYVGDYVLRFEALPGTQLAAESTANSTENTGSSGPGESAAPRGSVPSIQSGSPGGAGSMPPAPPVLSHAIPPAGGLPKPVARTVMLDTARGSATATPVHGASANGGNGSNSAPVATPSSQDSASSGRALPYSTPAPRPAGVSSPDLRPAAGLRESTVPPSGKGPRLGHRSALASLVDAVGRTFDTAVFREGTPADAAHVEHIERALTDELGRMRGNAAIAGYADVETLGRDARRELLDLGPLRALLEDTTVDEIHVDAADHIVAVRGGSRSIVDPGFSSDQAVEWAIARLAWSSGEPRLPHELVVERMLPDGSQFSAVLPPISSSGPALTLRPRRRFEVTLDDLIQREVLTRSTATFLHQCLAARANVLVVAGRTAAPPLLAALAAAVPPEARVLVLEAPDQGVVARTGATSLLLLDSGARGEVVARAAGRMGADHTIVGTFAGHVATTMLDAIADGNNGIIGAVRASGIVAGLARLVAEIAAARPGLGLEVAREWLASSIDIVIEVGSRPDGPLQVTRVAELAGTSAGAIVLRDLFVPEGTEITGRRRAVLVPTGLVPRLAAHLRATGARVDLRIFDQDSS